MGFPPTLQQVLDEEQAEIVAAYHADYEQLKRRAEERLRLHRTKRRTLLNLVAALSGQQTISRLPQPSTRRNA